MSSTNSGNQPAADDHAPYGPPAQEVIARGYEADTYDNKSVISVPLLVILFFVLAFGTVTVIFNIIAPTKSDPKAHPAAVERNKRPLNDRLAGIGREKEGDQPRLEPLKRRAGGELVRGMPQPELPDGNSPELHPEDLRVTLERFPALYQSGGGKIGLDKTMNLNDQALRSLFPVQASGTKPIDSRHVPTAANAGRGAAESKVVVPTLPKPEEKAPPKKPEPPKKPDDKKAEPPKKPDDKSPTDKKPGDKK